MAALLFFLSLSPPAEWHAASFASFDQRSVNFRYGKQKPRKISIGYTSRDRAQLLRMFWGFNLPRSSQQEFRFADRAATCAPYFDTHVTCKNPRLTRARLQRIRRVGGDAETFSLVSFRNAAIGGRTFLFTTAARPRGIKPGRCGRYRFANFAFKTTPCCRACPDYGSDIRVAFRR